MSKHLSVKIGDKFGYWTVVGDFVRTKFGTGRGANYVVRFPCVCVCGTTRLVRIFKLLSNSASCGCKTTDIHSKLVTVHGQNTKRGGKSHAYSVWATIIQRCFNPKSNYFHRYGGRGITVCPEWLTPVPFLEWAKEGCRDGLTIDRIDNDGPYSPENCRWVTMAVNSRNKSNTRNITAFGETKCATDWGLDPRCHVKPQTLVRRIEVRKMAPEEAILLPRERRKDAPRFVGNH